MHKYKNIMANKKSYQKKYKPNKKMVATKAYVQNIVKKREDNKYVSNYNGGLNNVLTTDTVYTTNLMQGIKLGDTTFTREADSINLQSFQLVGGLRSTGDGAGAVRVMVTKDSDYLTTTSTWGNLSGTAFTQGCLAVGDLVIGQSSYGRIDLQRHKVLCDKIIDVPPRSITGAQDIKRIDIRVPINQKFIFRKSNEQGEGRDYNYYMHVLPLGSNLTMEQSQLNVFWKE